MHVMAIMEDELIAIGQAAKLLGVAVCTLRRWEAKGIITAYRIGPRRDRRFRLSDLEKLAKE